MQEQGGVKLDPCTITFPATLEIENVEVGGRLTANIDLKIVAINPVAIECRHTDMQSIITINSYEGWVKDTKN